MLGRDADDLAGQHDGAELARLDQQPDILRETRSRCATSSRSSKFEMTGAGSP
jgi:hypothetical protein